MFYKWLVQLTICLHWFNPLVHLMGNEINKACEFSCDESVVEKLDYHGMRAYGDTLLNAIGIGGDYNNSLSSVTLNENKKIIKERLDVIMNFKKKSRFAVVATLVVSMLVCAGATVAGAYMPISANSGTRYLENYSVHPSTSVATSSRTRYLENYSAHPSTSIATRSRTGNWASADTATGNTHQEIMDSKLRFIEKVWNDKQEPFVIVEGISADNIADIESIQYLFDASSIYRNLITVSDTLYITPQISFSKLADDGHNPVYERYAFYLENPAKLSLSTFYQLSSGKMSLLIISSSGEIIYQSELSATINETISVSLQKGLNSIVLVHEMEERKCTGEISIVGKIGTDL